MPYPSKTDRQTILSAAVKDLAHGGIRDLSLRNLAASLDLAPTAIYRYFSDRSALEAALANEAARQLELALRKAADGCEPVTTIREMSSAYIKFARDNRHLYEVMMSLHAPEHCGQNKQEKRERGWERSNVEWSGPTRRAVELDAAGARAAKLCPSVIMKSRLRTLGVSRRG